MTPPHRPPSQPHPSPLPPAPPLTPVIPVTLLTLDTFADLLDLHGPDLARWPTHTTAQARALLARDDAARALLAAARVVEGGLGALPMLSAGPDLRAAIAAIASQQTQAPPDMAIHAGIHPSIHHPSIPMAAPMPRARGRRRQAGGRAAGRTAPLAWATRLAGGVAAVLVGVWLGANGLGPRSTPHPTPSATAQLALAIDDISLEQTP